jgi:hypothetical protein
MTEHEFTINPATLKRAPGFDINETHYAWSVEMSSQNKQYLAVFRFESRYLPPVEEDDITSSMLPWEEGINVNTKNLAS